MIVDFTHRNFGLDIMRATAITFVFVIHLLVNFITYDLWILWYLAYLGVDVFFVLSGFLIGNLLLQAINFDEGRFRFKNLRKFLLRRWMRTVPLYYVLLLVNFMAGFFLFHTIRVFDVRYLIWSQNLLHPPPSFFRESWSLSVEEWFYVLFPCGLFIFLTLIRGKRSHLVLAYTFLFIGTSILCRWVGADTKFGELTIALMRLDAIAYGVLFAVLDCFYLSSLFKRKAHYFGIAGLLVLMIAIVFFLKLNGKLYLLYYPLAGLALSSLLVYLKQISDRGVKPVLVKAVRLYSKISYSIYLNNLLVISLVKKYIPFASILQILIAGTVTLVLSYFTFRLIEKYFIDLREKLIPA